MAFEFNLKLFFVKLILFNLRISFNSFFTIQKKFLTLHIKFYKEKFRIEEVTNIKVFFPFPEIKLNKLFELDELKEFLALEKSKVLSLCHISNSLGTHNPVENIIKDAHSQNVQVVLYGAQSVPHSEINLKDIDCDFFTDSILFFQII